MTSYNAIKADLIKHFQGSVYTIDVSEREARALYKKGKPIPFTEAHNHKRWLFYKTGLIVPRSCSDYDELAKIDQNCIKKLNVLAIEASARGHQFLKVDSHGNVIGTNIKITEALMEALRVDVPNLMYDPAQRLLTWE